MEQIRQPEGLCLMWYQCEKCNKSERIWNSRPRVAPYVISCSSCSGEMKHVAWERDEYAPNHQPQKGERIFMDWSREAEEKLRREYIEKNWDSGDFPMKERTDLWKTKEEALQYFLDSWEFGQPTTITV